MTIHAEYPWDEVANILSMAIMQKAFLEDQEKASSPVFQKSYNRFHEILENYSKPNAGDAILNNEKPYLTWARRSIGLWRKRKNVNTPRRVSHKPGYVRARAKRKNSTDFYRRNEARLNAIGDEIFTLD